MDTGFRSNKSSRFSLVAAGLLGLCAATAQAQLPPDSPKLDVPYGPTHPVITQTMLRVAEVGPKDFVIDLGSGDGRINIEAARERGARGLGMDIDPELVIDSRARAKQWGVADKVRFIEQNLFDADLSRATVVTMYLGPSVTPRVAPKLLSQLRAGTRVVSNNFAMGDWKPDLTLAIRESGTPVHFWWVPAKVAGRWVSVGEKAGKSPAFSMELRQEYQRVKGEATLEGVEGVWLRDIRLAGTRLMFNLMEKNAGEYRFRRFDGTVKLTAKTAVIEGDLYVDGIGKREQSKLRMVRERADEPGPPGAWIFTRQ